MSTRPHLVAALRVVSTLGLGIAAGMAISTSQVMLPAMYKTLDPLPRLKFWSDIYEREKAQTDTVTTLCCLCLGVSAYYADPVSGRGLLGVYRRQLLAAAAASIVLMVPWTAFVMRPNARHLKELEDEVSSGQKEGSLIGLESDNGILKWDSHHTVRTIGYTVAFALSAVELLSF